MSHAQGRKTGLCQSHHWQHNASDFFSQCFESIHKMQGISPLLGYTWLIQQHYPEALVESTNCNER